MRSTCATSASKSAVRSSTYAMPAVRARASRLDGLTSSAFLSDAFASSRLPASSARLARNSMRVDAVRIDLEDGLRVGDSFGRVVVRERARRSQQGRHVPRIHEQRQLERLERVAVLVLLERQLSPGGVDGRIARRHRDGIPVHGSWLPAPGRARAAPARPARARAAHPPSRPWRRLARGGRRPRDGPASSAADRARARRRSSGCARRPDGAAASASGYFPRAVSARDSSTATAGSLASSFWSAPRDFVVASLVVGTRRDLKVGRTGGAIGRRRPGLRLARGRRRARGPRLRAMAGHLAIRAPTGVRNGAS